MSNASNSADDPFPALPAAWTVIPVFNLVTFLLVIILNSAVLLIYILDKQLRVPFSVYLMNLLGANIVIAVQQNPLDIIVSYANSWYPGQKACTVYLYASYTVSGGIMNSHALITINRIWAICFPFHYKLHHSTKVAIWMCIAMWSYMHALVIPGLVIDGLYHRLPLSVMGCSVNLRTQPEWQAAVNWLIGNIPVIVVIFAFPIICIIRHRSRTIIHQHNEPVIVNSNPPGTRTISATPTANKAANPGTEKRKERSYAFMVLTLMTCSATVFWTPIMVFYGIAPYGYFNYTFCQVARMVYSWESVADPILFAVAMRDVWRSGRRMLGWWRYGSLWDLLRYE